MIIATHRFKLYNTIYAETGVKRYRMSIKMVTSKHIQLCTMCSKIDSPNT
jgi:hypothetical protein